MILTLLTKLFKEQLHTQNPENGTNAKELYAAMSCKLVEGKNLDKAPLYPYFENSYKETL